MGILGSIPILGNWKKNEMFYLKWNNGNIWTGEILNEKIPMDFEFKFVISFNRYVKKWETGNNNKVTFEKLLNEIKYKKMGILINMNIDIIQKENFYYYIDGNKKLFQI